MMMMMMISYKLVVCHLYVVVNHLCSSLVIISVSYFELCINAL